MKQTAVEWLVKSLELDTRFNGLMNDVIEQAKQMEAEQNLQQYNEGYNLGRWHLVSDSITPKGHKIFEMYKEWESAQTISKMETIRENGIVELSDEEIKEIAKQHLGDRSATNIYYWLIEGMQLYREQLKQTQ